jgi:hypothetical protein
MPSEPTPRIPGAVKEELARRNYERANQAAGWSVIGAERQAPYLDAACEDLEAIAPLLCAGLERERDEFERRYDRSVQAHHLADIERNDSDRKLAEVRAEVEAALSHTLGERPREEILAILDSSSSLSGDGEERCACGHLAAEHHRGDGVAFSPCALCPCENFSWESGAGSASKSLSREPGNREAFTTYEKSLLIARLARGKSVIEWRAAEEEPVVDKLMRVLDALTQPVPGNSGGVEEAVALLQWEAQDASMWVERHWQVEKVVGATLGGEWPWLDRVKVYGEATGARLAQEQRGATLRAAAALIAKSPAASTQPPSPQEGSTDA